jgi:hypothetical protein
LLFASHFRCYQDLISANHHQYIRARFSYFHRNIFFQRSHPTAGVTGKGGIWRKKPPDAESAVGARIPKVWAAPALVRVHAVLGGFCKTVLNLNLIPLLITAYIGGLWMLKRIAIGKNCPYLPIFANKSHINVIINPWFYV